MSIDIFCYTLAKKIKLDLNKSHKCDKIIKSAKGGVNIKPFYQIHESGFSVTYHKNQIVFPSHMHNEVEMLYVFEGEQGIEINDRSVTVGKGCCAVIFPNIQHSYIKTNDNTESGDEYRSVMIFLPPYILYDAFPSLLKTLPENCIVEPQNISEDAILAFNKIIGETIPAARIGWAQIILGNIAPYLKAAKLDAGADSAAISKLMNYISTNFQNSISLEILSDALGMSKSQISHIFSTKIRINLRSYVGILRSEYAARLMRTSNDSLSHIASQSGFDSLRTFNRVFREVYGLTPSQFRSNIRKYIGQE